MAKAAAKTEAVTWATETRKLSELKAFDKNPRYMTDKQRLDLKESLKRFGLVEIPVINKDGTILAGHQRVKQMLSDHNGAYEIEVRVPSRMLTYEEAREYVLRSNKNTGSWDLEMLNTEFDLDTLIDAGFATDELLSGTDDDDEFGRDESKGTADGLEEMDLKAFEHHDYVVLAFTNSHDWLRACEMLGIKKVNVSTTPTRRKVGVGRVVDGRKLFEL